MNEHEAFLLIATPDAPAHVQETMMLVAVHGDEGSLGFVVNRSIPHMTMSDALRAVGVQIDPRTLRLDGSVAKGGPVRNDSAWLLFHGPDEGQPEDSCSLAPSLHVTASPEAAAEILQRRPTPRSLLCRGHTTWEGSELDAEIAAGLWLRLEVNPALVFDVPFEQRWSEALCAALNLSRRWLGAARFARA